MTERGLRKLKRKFIVTAMTSFFIVMMLISSFICISNFVLTRSEIRNTLSYIAENEGLLPENEGRIQKKRLDIARRIFDVDSPEDVREIVQDILGLEVNYDSPDFFYSTRYFAVSFDENGETENVILSHIASVDEDVAEEFARYTAEGVIPFGRFDDFYYLVDNTERGGKIVVCLDCAAQIAVTKRLLLIAMILVALGMAVSYIILNLLAGKLLKPEIRSAELQKEFITNASHELKTPLAVIRANTELMEMSQGSNEWTDSNMRQLDRLTGLIQNLVMISRASERDMQGERTQLNVSAAVKETAQNFQPVAEQEEKTLLIDVPDEILFSADEGQIRTLTSLLVDNAIKYCDPKGEVSVSLLKKNRALRLTVTNSFAEGKGVDYDQFFERFYRGDRSHNTEKEGYGIGLSMAESICQDYDGRIRVSWNEGRIAFRCILN